MLLRLTRSFNTGKGTPLTTYPLTLLTISFKFLCFVLTPTSGECLGTYSNNSYVFSSLEKCSSMPYSRKWTKGKVFNVTGAHNKYESSAVY